jgi:hypothetical protein
VLGEAQQPLLLSKKPENYGSSVWKEEQLLNGSKGRNFETCQMEVYNGHLTSWWTDG